METIVVAKNVTAGLQIAAVTVPPLAASKVSINGKINVMDANLVRRYASKLAELDAGQVLAADVDGNGKVNAVDANMIRRYTVKLVEEFPVR